MRALAELDARGVRAVLVDIDETLTTASRMLFDERFGLGFTQVPYRGNAPQMIDLLAGHALFGFTQLQSAVEPARAGTLRALVASGPKRSPLLSDVPTLADLGELHQPLLGEPAAPPADRRRRHQQRLGNCCIRQTVGRHQQRPRPNHLAMRRGRRPRHGLENLTLPRGHQQSRNGSPHVVNPTK